LRKIIKNSIGLGTATIMKISVAILLFVFLNSTFGKQEGKARQYVYSILHLNGINNPIFFWMISTTPVRIRTETSFKEGSTKINLSR